jgi:AcrR family transcriptional regulator
MEDQGPQDGKGTGVDAEVRRHVEEAMLELSGVGGFRGVSLDLLLARSGADAEQFDSWFTDLEDCFAAAYRTEAEALCEAMLGASERAGDWRAGVEAGLAVVLRLTVARPALARALVREVHVVGGDSLAKHEEVLERLAAAMDERCGMSGDGALQEGPGREQPRPLLLHPEGEGADDGPERQDRQLEPEAGTSCGKRK